MAGDELIDDDSITNHTIDVTYYNGYSLVFQIQLIMGSISLLLGVPAIGTFTFLGILFGSLVLIIFWRAIISRHGVHICFDSKYIAQFDYSFGYKKKKWKSTSVFTDICILKLGKKDMVHSRFGQGTLSIDSSKNEVYFMTPDHRHRILIKTCKSMKEGIQIAEFLAEKLDKKLVAFNPKISQKTLNRRR